MSQPDQFDSHQTDVRFDRIEKKIDILSETVVALARAEEKLIGLERVNTTILSTLMKLDERLSAQELVQFQLSSTYSNFSKVFWSVLTAVCTSGAIWWLSQHMK
jgi:hypothetical protein